ncbi:MAG: heavy metal translocating P-type ATPase, partial [Leptospiraceae bacterium]|nr:heavy metal translocating P-type ATPase [Leptospiraceae bacterium]
VIDLVNEAQQAKSRTQNLANRAAAWLAFVAIGAGIITSAGWLLMGQELSFVLERTVTVMVISCPHALGLAIPLVVAISTAMSARNGLLIRNRTAFENARKISALVFDKTGTLTKGVFKLARTESFAELSENESLQIAASLEQHSEHPIAAGLLDAAREKDLQIKEVSQFETMTGRGVKGQVDGQMWAVVSSKYLSENAISIPEGGMAGATEVYLLRGDQPAGRLSLADEVRPESKDAVRTLQKRGIKLFMATGDSEATAKAVSDELGLDGYFSRVLPEDKVKVIKDLQKEGHFVAMTGDGVNDAPALATANVGIAVGSGTDVAASTADIVLVRSNPSDIAQLILFGRATYRKMIQNLIWATGYNAIALPLATGFIPGLIISPAVGAIFMSLSTIIVAINAQLLKRSIETKSTNS